MLNTHDFDAIINSIVQKILRSGTTTGAEEILVLLTKTEPKTGLWHDDFEANFAYESEARTVTPFSSTKLGQRQYLIKFDLSKTYDESPKYSAIPTGWTWRVYGERKPRNLEPIVMILKKLEKSGLSSTSKKSLGIGEIEGFSIVKLPEKLVFPDTIVFDEYAIMIDPAVFTVQIKSN